jgi:hypothetical protein
MVSYSDQKNQTILTTFPSYHFIRKQENLNAIDNYETLSSDSTKKPHNSNKLTRLVNVYSSIGQFKRQK